MKVYLDRTEERIVLLLEGLRKKGGNVEIVRVEGVSAFVDPPFCFDQEADFCAGLTQALEPVREALHHAVKYFTERTS